MFNTCPIACKLSAYGYYAPHWSQDYSRDILSIWSKSSDPWVGIWLDNCTCIIQLACCCISQLVSGSVLLNGCCCISQWEYSHSVFCTLFWVCCYTREQPYYISLCVALKILCNIFKHRQGIFVAVNCMFWDHQNAFMHTHKFIGYIESAWKGIDSEAIHRLNKDCIAKTSGVEQDWEHHCGQWVYRDFNIQCVQWV